MKQKKVIKSANVSVDLIKKQTNNQAKVIDYTQIQLHMPNTNLVASFGELLIRIQSNSDQLINANAIIYPGGSEANVVYALAQKQINTRYLTVIPDNKISEQIIEILSSKTIDTTQIIYQGDRLGSYILLSKNGLTNGEVIYDRKYSSFSQLKKNTVNWNQLLEGCTWFHWSAITPALSKESAEILEEVLKTAEMMKIKISVDLNYRSKLWQYGKNPLDIMPQLIKYCDVIMGNIWASNKMLGTSIIETLNRRTEKEEYGIYANKVAKEIFNKYPKCKNVANIFRFMDNDKHNLIFATYHTPSNNYLTESLETNSVIDRIGSGDAFMAGLIYGLINNLEAQQVINTALEFGYKKLFIAGDFINFEN